MSVPVRAVVFDAMGTLVELEPPAPRLRDALQRLGGIDVGLEAARRGFGAEIAYYLDHHAEGGDPAALEDLRQRCAEVMHEALEVDGLDRADVRMAMVDALSFRAFPDVVPALEELRARGLALVVASNWDCSLPHWLEQAGLANLIDGAVSSAAVGAPKPAPAVFRAALELAGADPAEAVHVGDSIDADIKGALAAGMRAVFIDREGSGRVEGVPTVRSLSELGSLV